MAGHGLITRRAALVGALASTTALAAPLAMELDGQPDNACMGAVNVAGERVTFDHSLAPEFSLADAAAPDLVASNSQPEVGAEYLVLDAWGQLQVRPLVEHTSYGQTAMNSRMGYSTEFSAKGRSYLMPVMVIGKVLKRWPLEGAQSARA